MLSEEYPVQAPPFGFNLLGWLQKTRAETPPRELRRARKTRRQRIKCPSFLLKLFEEENKGSLQSFNSLEAAALPTPLRGSQVMAMAGKTPGNPSQEQCRGQNIPNNSELCAGCSLPPSPEECS